MAAIRRPDIGQDPGNNIRHRPHSTDTDLHCRLWEIVPDTHNCRLAPEGGTRNVGLR